MNSMPASPPSQTAPDVMADSAVYAEMLRELAEMGMDIARALHRQTTTPDGAAAGSGGERGPGDAADLRAEAVSRAFDRVARCVRRTILLARRISEPVVATSPDGRSVAGARRHIVRVLEDEIQRDVPDETQREALTAELHERLDGPDVAGRCARPAGRRHHPGDQAGSGARHRARAGPARLQRVRAADAGRYRRALRPGHGRRGYGRRGDGRRGGDARGWGAGPGCVGGRPGCACCLLVGRRGSG